MVDYAANLKVKGLPQNFCFKGTAADIMQQIASFLIAQVPNSITNVWLGNSEPTSPNYALWVRQDNSGNFLGLYAFTEGSWVQIVAAPALWNSFESDLTPVDGTTVLTNKSFEGEYCIDQNGTVFVSAGPSCTVGNGASNRIDFDLPVPIYPGSNFGIASLGAANGSNLTMWCYNTGTTTASWGIEGFVAFTAAAASARFNFFYRGDI